MYSTILHKRNSTSGSTPVPDSLSAGEIAVNVADGKLFTKLDDGSIATFLNSNQTPYVLNDSLSSNYFLHGGNTVTGLFAGVLGGYNNDISGSGSTTVNGEDNDIAGDYAFIGSGLNNKITSTGDYAAILGGRNNLINHQNSFAIGSNLSSHAEDFTYVNNISGMFWGDGSNLTNLNISNASANDNEVRSLTGNWQSTYTTVQNNSANWNLVAITDPLKFKFIADGVNKDYSVSGTNNSTNASYINVYVENVKQEPVNSYTLSADLVKFVDAPENGSEIVIITPNTKLVNVQDTSGASIPVIVGSGGGNFTWPLVAKGDLNMNGYSIVNVSPTSISFNNGRRLGTDEIDSWNNASTIVLSNSSTWTNNKGKSAYEIWLEQPANNNGTISDFLNSIRGTDGANGINGFDGINGQSAYDIWLIQGNTGTRQDFLNDIKGADGTNGVSAYEIWLSAGNTGTITNFLSSIKGTSGINGTNGSNGANTYEIWLSAGNTGTISNFLSSIKGEKGDIGYTGQNAHEIWLSEGNVGTVNDFLNSLIGPKGNTGDTVINTDYLTEGSVNLFYRSDRVEDDSPVKSVANKQGNITLDIDDVTNLRSTLNAKQPSGNYVELVNNLIPSIYLPGTVDEIQEFGNYTSLLANPTPSAGILYITTDNNKVYRWSGTLYIEIVSSPGTTDSLVEGSSNKYFTTQRASDAAPVQSVANKTGNVLLGVSDIQNLQTSLTATNTTTTAITAKLSTPIGAYSNNSVIPINTPFEVILRNLLTTVIPYVYVQPVLTVLPSPATLSYEIGTNLNQTLNISYTPNDAGSATQFRVRSGTNTLSSTSTATPFISAFQLTSTTTFTTEVDYLAGQQKPNNVGDLQPNPVQAGTRTTTTTFAAFRNNFYTADTATGLATTSNQIRLYSNSTTSRSFNIPIVPGVKRVSFAFPSNLSNINVTVIQVGFGDITSSFSSSTVSVAGANGYLPINYSVYTLLVPSGFLQNQTYSVSF